jgi:hypothetical protein
VMPSPYGTQRPSSTAARSPTTVASSCASRDFPDPASPSSVTASAGALLHRLLEGGEQLRQLERAADERRLEAPRQPGRVGSEIDER